MTEPYLSQPKKPNMTSVLIGVSNWLELHPKLVVRSMHTVVVVLAGFTLLNTGLFTVQNSRTPLFTSISGKDYSLRPIASAKQSLESEHATTNLDLIINGKTMSLNALQVGIALDTDKTLQALTQKTGWERLPIVGAIKDLVTDIKPKYQVNREQLSSSLREVVPNETVPAKDAVAVIPADVKQPVTITPEAEGSEINVLIAAEQIGVAAEKGRFDIEIKNQVIIPKWNKLDLTAFVPAIDAARNTSITFEADGKKLVLSPEILAPMVRVDSSGSALKMSLDAALLEAYLKTQASNFYQAPIATKTVQTDGVEVSRTEGVPGKELDAATTAQQAIKAFENGVINIVPATTTLTPALLVNNSYTNTNSGLQKLIEDFAKSRGGKYRVAAVELNVASPRSAFYEADTPIVTASTYKLFVAYGVMQKVETGGLTLQTQTSLGTVSDCMYKMIHVSDNACAAVLEKLVGHESLAALLKSKGITNTNLINITGDKHSTARDEMTLVTKLHNRELLNEQSTNYILDLMKKQIYRSGIPAGSNGSIVADKVGFLYALHHDIGIVYSPKATYALVILTDGAGGWNNIKLLSKQIYDFYNQ